MRDIVRVVLDKKVVLLVPIFLAVLLFFTVNALHSQNPDRDWKADFRIEEGFSMDIDTQGYEIPTAIAFVPNPGDGPNDPFYFVTELRGQVKVITNNRRVRTFADLQLDLPADPLSAEAGMAGICLDPSHGYVFVTFAERDDSGILKNNVHRFETEPERFSIESVSELAIRDVFARHPTGGSHFIGACQVSDNLLYTSVGDGFFNPQASQNLDSPLGKVLRMTLDGKPSPNNPFYQDDDTRRAVNYVWAYGLRNPYGLKIVNNRVFVADNGLSVDRFLEIKEGQNYLWDSTDTSIASKADFVISPSGGVVHLDYLPADNPLFPQQFRNRFYLMVPFDPDEGTGNIARGVRGGGILSIEFDFAKSELLSVPKYFLRHQGSDAQAFSGVAFGPDGLYIVPIFPIEEGTSAVIRIRYDPTNGHPYSLSQLDGNQLMNQKGCLGCHTIPGVRAQTLEQGAPVGPTLARDDLVSRLRSRLNSKEYVEALAEVDQLDIEPFISFQDARRNVLEADGMDKIRTWITYRIQEPRFDGPDSLMPNLGITEQEAILMTDALLEEGDQSRLRWLSPIFPESVRRRHLGLYFAGGILLGGIVTAFSFFVLRRVYPAIR